MNLMHSCRQVARLLALAYDEPLGWWDRIRLRAHLSMCGDCSRTAAQLDDIETMSRRLLADDLVPDDAAR